ncbi:hypothetical protein EDB80DRAFT_818174 [Ilyonectria destructans]|nr:hypothetical protein EDB80DRAFT_818174 [Ilyonectria destructans]
MDPSNAVVVIMTLPVKVDIDDLQARLRFFMDNLKIQDGCLGIRLGSWHDNPQKIDLMTVWANSRSSEAWVASKAHEESVSQLRPGLTGRPTGHTLYAHETMLRAIIGTPVLEVVILQARENVEEGELIGLFEHDPCLAACRGLVSGRSLNSALSGERDFVALIGWSGMDAYPDAFRDSQLGYGTWQSSAGEIGLGVFEALKVGYRHLCMNCVLGLGIGLIDEDEVGLRRPPGPRSGGLRLEDPPAGALRPGPDRFPSSWSGSRFRYHELGLEYLDLYLVCFPVLFKRSPSMSARTYSHLPGVIS